ncbi:MAG TPA: Fe(2+) transporter permease subunit FeoB [Aeromonadales bacterium]|nr:Fe(2+) transporter permease subunit FeoB [Aeromonadales bacterium]
MKACCEDIAAPVADEAGTDFTIALIGNPNSGKTSLFNRLTGTRQKTGNWPGVTVEKKSGYFKIDQHKFKIVDLPGTYSLDAADTSIDERIARGYVQHHRHDLFINILDATTLERGLYLTLQLREQGVPVIVLLNMMDVARKRNMHIDSSELSRLIQCPVVEVSLKQDKELNQLQQLILQSSTHPVPALEIPYADELETLLKEFSEKLQLNRRQAINRLQDDGDDETVQFYLKKIVDETQKSFSYLRAKSYFLQAQQIAEKVIRQAKVNRYTISDSVDKWVLGSYTGIPIFLFIIYLLFLFSINIGGAFVDFFDLTTQALLVDGLGQGLLSLGVPEWIKLIIADGIGSGIQVVATFIPIIGALYLFLTVLEESGYMARAAFVMDRFMRKLGVSGKAFVPLIVGFGCNVPAIMATRTLDSQRERIMTVLMAPFMSCGARLTVYALFAAIFFPRGGQNIVFLLYLTGIGFAILTALILRHTVLKGDADDFMMDLPNYQRPGLQNIAINTWNKLKGFVTGAGKIIIVVVMLINIVNSIGTDGSFGNQNTDKSLLSATARTMTPIFRPMGITNDNWPATVGILTGVLAKEVVVGTLDALYSSIDDVPGTSLEQSPYDLLAHLKQAAQTVPKNLKETLNNLSDPIGLGTLAPADSLQQVAVEQDVNMATFSAMKRRFDGKIGAFAYMLFVLLYFPCVAATSAMYRETGKNWAMLGVIWSTSLAYGTSVIFYQLATFSRHPIQSVLWTVSLSLAFVLGVYVLFKSGKNKNEIPVKVNFS